ncbi:asparagine synthase [Escherichia coli]|nr:asparagine synthase [Escherichia coli]AUQ36342.1 asparagine synthase [Escherichia coli]
MVSYFYPSLKSPYSIKPVKNYRSINKYAITPYPFSQISNRHYVFYFSTAKSLAHRAALRHFFKQANTTSNKYQVNGEGYVFNFWHIRYQNRRS